MSDETPMSYPNGQGGRKVNDRPQPDTWHTMASVPVPYNVPMAFSADFPQEWEYMLADLFRLWASKLARNRLRMRYYSGKNVLHDFGISIPPQLLSVETVVGWPQKAVDTMAVRSRFDGFSASDPDTQDMLDRISAASRLRVKYRQAIQSTLIYSCSFATVAVGADGSPRIDIHSAETAAARWDDALGRIAYGMTITGWRDGNPTSVNLYTEDYRVSLWNDGRSFWEWVAQPYAMGRPTMEALVYRPTQSKPFGQSRITRAVMSITDSAVRESLRTEISAEFFTSPQKYLLGADRDALRGKTKWEAYIGNIMGVSYNGVDGVMPQFGQLQQASMQQTVDYMRLLAARFSGETNVPISQLGVIHDNPSSAEAIYAASEPLIIECQDLNDNSRETLRSLAQMCMAAEQGVPLAELGPEWRDFTPNFANPAMPSIVSTADAAVKIAAAVPGFAGTEAFWKMLGLPEDTRREVRAELTEATADAMLAQIFSAPTEPAEPEEPTDGGE